MGIRVCWHLPSINILSFINTAKAYYYNVFEIAPAAGVQMTLWPQHSIFAREVIATRAVWPAMVSIFRWYHTVLYQWHIFIVTFRLDYFSVRQYIDGLVTCSVFVSSFSGAFLRVPSQYGELIIFLCPVIIVIINNVIWAACHRLIYSSSWNNIERASMRYAFNRWDCSGLISGLVIIFPISRAVGPAAMLNIYFSPQQHAWNMPLYHMNKSSFHNRQNGINIIA